jgi:hypothetical protein
MAISPFGCLGSMTRGTGVGHSRFRQVRGITAANFPQFPHVVMLNVFQHRASLRERLSRGQDGC